MLDYFVQVFSLTAGFVIEDSFHKLSLNSNSHWGLAVCSGAFRRLSYSQEQFGGLSWDTP